MMPSFPRRISLSVASLFQSFLISSDLSRLVYVIKEKSQRTKRTFKHFISLSLSLCLFQEVERRSTANRTAQVRKNGEVRGSKSLEWKARIGNGGGR